MKEALNPIHAQYEVAARLYCKKAGLDADLKIPTAHPQGLAVPYFIRNWQMVAEDLHDFSMKLVSIKEAAAAKSAIMVTPS